jgi:hypothetical protein
MWVQDDVTCVHPGGQLVMGYVSSILPRTALPSFFDCVSFVKQAPFLFGDGAAAGASSLTHIPSLLELSPLALFFYYISIGTSLMSSNRLDTSLKQACQMSPRKTCAYHCGVAQLM